MHAGGGGRVAVASRAGPLRVWRCLDDFDRLEPHQDWAGASGPDVEHDYRDGHAICSAGCSRGLPCFP